MKLSLSEITADGRAQPRASMDGEIIDEYGEDMKRGDKFPPVVVFFDGAKHWLADGFHRYYAAVAAQKEKLDCEVQEGTEDEAIWFSCGANKTHGLRRTNADKRRAVLRLLTHPKFRRKTQEEIAEQCGVVQSFVSKIIKELEAKNITVIPEKEDHGRSPSTMTFAPQTSQEGAFVAKSLHEIERHLDMMPDPKQAAIDFPAEQRFLFPISRVDEMAAWFATFATAWRAAFPKAAE